MNPNDTNYRREPMPGTAGRPMPQGTAAYSVRQDQTASQRPPFRPLPQSSEAETAAYAAANSYTPYEEMPPNEAYRQGSQQGAYGQNWQQAQGNYQQPHAAAQNRFAAQGRPARRARPQSGGIPLPIQQSFNDFRGVFSKLFSKEPERALQYDLSALSWSLLLIVNLLFYAFARTSVLQRSLVQMIRQILPQSLGGMDASAMGLSWSGLFFNSLLGQLIFLILMLGWGFFVGFLVHSEARPALQYVKTLALCTLSQTLMLLPILLFSFFAPGLAMIALLGSAFFFIHFYARAFAVAHPSPRTNQFWYFALAFLLAVLLYTWMPGLQLFFF